MKTVIQKLSIPKGSRVLVMSDIHGEPGYLEGALRAAGYGQDDTLILLGDYVEKGPRSLEALRSVMHLCRQGGVYAVMGNNDPWTFQMLETLDGSSAETVFARHCGQLRWFGHSLLQEMFMEQGLELHTAADLLRARGTLLKAYAEEWDFIHGLPTILEAGRYIFVHGGIPHENLNAFQGEDPYRFMKWDAFQEDGLRFDRYVVVGHWPTCLYRTDFHSMDPLVSGTQHIINIDGGCGLKDFGQLNVLMIPDVERENAEYVSYDAMSAATALDSQEASEHSFYIHWGDNAVQILDRQEDFAYVAHQRTGHRLFIPNAFVYPLEDGWETMDYADYQLPIRAGESIKLLLRTSRGVYAKARGICGWYQGRIE